TKMRGTEVTEDYPSQPTKDEGSHLGTPVFRKQFAGSYPHRLHQQVNRLLCLFFNHVP
ncbi:unnamed protein product, partial [Heterobilharzia americana]